MYNQQRNALGGVFAQKPKCWGWNMSIRQPESSILQQAVLWDLDGTLIDTRQAHWQAWRETMAAEGFDLTWESFVQLFGQRNDTTLRKWLRPDLPDSEIERIAETKERLYRQILPEQPPRLLPGVENWLHWLRANGWRQALATMTPFENMEAIFSAVKTSTGGSFKDFLDAVVTGNEVLHGKPDPEIFLLAARRLQVPPERCIVIEDSSAGVQAARRAGMRAIAVNPHPCAGADLTAPSLAELAPRVVEDFAGS